MPRWLRAEDDERLLDVGESDKLRELSVCTSIGMLDTLGLNEANTIYLNK